MGMRNKVNGEVLIASEMPGAYYKILTLLEKRLVDCGQIFFKDEGLCVQMPECVETNYMEMHAREFLKNTVELTQTVGVVEPPLAWCQVEVGCPALVRGGHGSPLLGARIERETGDRQKRPPAWVC